MIYLDNGATSMPKPQSVIQAVNNALDHYASPGRGSSKASIGAAEVLYELRKTAGEMFDCDLEQVVLTTSATHGLNIAIKSIVRPGVKVVTSCMEHNAVARPLHAIKADVRVAKGNLFDDAMILKDFDRLLTREVGACIVNHVSNVFGWILPVYEIAEMCRQRHIPFILDASQSAGTQDISMEDLNAAFIAMPGHKGLLGPAGTGLLICGQGTMPLMEGGTGSNSREMDMPAFLPDRLEAGTHNIPGAAGLLAGMKCVGRRGSARILRHEQKLMRMAAEKLSEHPRIHVYTGENQAGVLSFTIQGHDGVEFAEKLADRWNIALRAGLHCAPMAHEAAGTLDSGTIRLSPGPFNSQEDIRGFVRAVMSEL